MELAKPHPPPASSARICITHPGEADEPWAKSTFHSEVENVAEKAPKKWRQIVILPPPTDIV